MNEEYLKDLCQKIATICTINNVQNTFYVPKFCSLLSLNTYEELNINDDLLKYIINNNDVYSAYWILIFGFKDVFNEQESLFPLLEELVINHESVLDRYIFQIQIANESFYSEKLKKLELFL